MTGTEAREVFLLGADYVRALLENKYVLFVGDSSALLPSVEPVVLVMRGIYMDMVSQIHRGDEPMSDADIKNRNLRSFCGDRLVNTIPLHMHRVFTQAREFCSPFHLIQFMFTTRLVQRLLISSLQGHEG